VAPTYDRLNGLLSMGLDRRWRRETAALLSSEAGELLVDVCGGTGDLALEVQRQHPQCRVLLTDFAEGMLRLAVPKIATTGAPWPVVAAADASRLPLPNASCAGFTAAFGFRNLRSARAGLLEAHRVLRPGGRLAILEFHRPTSLLGRARAAFVRVLVPTVAWCVSREHASAYGYLVRSIARFITVDEMCELIEASGFVSLEVHPRLMGTVTIIGATRQ